MSKEEFIGLLFLVGIPTIYSVFKFSYAVARFASKVDQLTEWQKTKDKKDIEQDARLNDHEIRLTHLEKIKERVG